MSKLHGDFEVGDKVRLVYTNNRPWSRDEGFTKTQFIIEEIHIRERRLVYQVHSHPSVSYFFCAENLEHV